MTERSYPFVLAAGEDPEDPSPSPGRTTDAEFSAMFRQLFPSSVLGYYGSSSLKVLADSSGMQVKGQAGLGFVRGHFYSNDAEMLLPIDANLSGSLRVDTVVLHLEYGTVNAIDMRLLTGVAGAGAPALTQTDSGVFQLPLANVNVAPGAVSIAASAVTDRRPWWGLEFFKMAGLVVGPTEPAADQAFIFLKTS